MAVKQKKKQVVTVHEPKIDSPVMTIPVIKHDLWKPVYKYPFDKMKIGQSFTVTRDKANRHVVSGRVHYFHLSTPKRFITRTVKNDKGEKMTRVWRIA